MAEENDNDNILFDLHLTGLTASRAPLCEVANQVRAAIGKPPMVLILVARQGVIESGVSADGRIAEFLVQAVNCAASDAVLKALTPDEDGP